MIPLISCFLLGALGVFLASFLFIKREKLRHCQVHLQQLEIEYKQLEQRFEENFEENVRLREELASLKAKSETNLLSAQEKISWLEKAQTQLQSTFTLLSENVLNQAQKNLLNLTESKLELFKTQQMHTSEQSGNRLKELLDPIRTSLNLLEEDRKKEHRLWNQAYGSLQEMVKAQSLVTESLQNETRYLTHALKPSNARGLWGEIQLKRIVELAGMTSYCDFQTQGTVHNKDDPQAARLRPDLVVRLPGGRQIVVDAKAPLKAFLESIEPGLEEKQKLKKLEHAQQLKQHVSELSSKTYWKQFQGIDFVIMFVPGDIFLHEALSELPELLEWAAEKKVLLATPTSLIALLKACSYSWHHSTLESKLSKIVEVGSTLYSRLCTFSSHFEELGKFLEKSSSAYNKLVSSWQSRVLTSAKKLSELKSSQEPLKEMKFLDPSLRPGALKESIQDLKAIDKEAEEEKEI